MITGDSKAFGYHFIKTLDGRSENSLRVTMSEEMMLNNEPVEVHTTGELQLDGTWNGNVLYRIGEDDKFWVGRDPKLRQSLPEEDKETINGLLTANGEIVEIALFEGFKDIGTWIKYTKEGYIAFHDHLIPDPRIKVLTNFDLLFKDYKKFMNEYENYKSPENMVLKILNRIDERPTNKQNLGSQKQIYINYRDNAREYLGECNITEHPDGFTVDVSGRGLLDYKDQGFIYSNGFKNGLPDGFCYERARSNIAIGNYSRGFLSGKAILVEDDFIKIGEFFENELKSGSMILRGDTLTVKSQNFVDSMPNGQSIVKYEEDNIYDGEMVEGLREGKGMIIRNKSQILISGEFENDFLIGEPKVNFPNGVEIQLIKDKDMKEKKWKEKLEHFEKMPKFEKFRTMRIISEDSVYEGEVKNFKPHGRGLFSSHDQYSIEGSFENGEAKGNSFLEAKNYQILLNIEDSVSKNSTAVFSLPFFFLGFRQDSYIKEYHNLEDNYFMMALESGDFDVIKTASKLEIIEKEELKDMANSEFGYVFNFESLPSYGVFYTGQMVKGETPAQWFFDGKGKSLDVLGNIYEGEFRMNQFHGQGILKQINGDVIEGEFRNGSFVEKLNGGGIGVDSNMNGHVDQFAGDFRGVALNQDVLIQQILAKELYKRQFEWRNWNFNSMGKRVFRKNLFKLLKKFKI